MNRYLLTVLIFVFFYNFATGQKSGTVDYIVKTDFKDPSPKEGQGRLVFKWAKSIYNSSVGLNLSSTCIWVDTLSPKAQPKDKLSITKTTPVSVYLDNKRKHLVSTLWHNSVNIAVVEGIDLISWEVTNEKKFIGEFECKKAIGIYAGREYHAWFSTKIKVPYGPWKLIGLPGLVLEASESEGHIQFVFNGFSRKVDKSTKVLKPSKEIEMNKSDFQDLFKTNTKDFYEEFAVFKDSSIIMKIDYSLSTERDL